MIITLTTDFGLTDPFVGIMKGVMLGIAPNVRIVDITHEIHSYDIVEANFTIDSFYRYFPAGTVHVIVVDPGVGSSRRPLAAFAREQYFIAPDNGVLSSVLEPEQNAERSPAVYEITNDRLFAHPVSRTFHGRDIFAPTAAHIASGTPVESVGECIADYVMHPLPRPRMSGPGRLAAKVLRIDKFGNIITNLRIADLGRNFNIRIADRTITKICRSFSEAVPGELFLIEGSTGYIEIALNRDAAAACLNASVATEIEVETGSSNH